MNTMQFNHTITLCCLSTYALFTGCSQESVEQPAASAEPLSTDIIARIDGNDIVFADVAKTAERRAYNLFSDQSERAYTETVHQALLAAEAEAAGYFQDPEVLNRIRSLAVQKLVQDEVDKKIASTAISEDELKAYYEQHKASFSRPAMARGQLLYLFKRQGTGASDFAQKRAAIPEALKQGEDFTQLVKQYSDNPAERSTGGFTGWIVANEMHKRYPQAIVEALFSEAAKTQVVGPIDTEQALYFVKLAEYRPAAETPFELVRSQIEQKVRQAKYQDRYTAYLTSLEKKYAVDRFKDNYQEQLKIAASQYPVGGPPRGPAGQ